MLNLDQFRALAAEWRQDAVMLERRGLQREARIFESFASDLEQRLRTWLDELLTLEAAAGEVGMTYDAIRKRIARGVLPNSGRQGSPKIRRADLLNANGDTLRLVSGEPDIAETVLRARER